MDSEFSQKQINHIFHYTKSFDSLLKIIEAGFAPSYCEEKITDLTYLIPMVSFCNISIGDVGLYMRYGNYGIGMSTDWAIKNQISPVIYVHENTPFRGLHKSINVVLLQDMAHRKFEKFLEDIKKANQNEEGLDNINLHEDENLTKLLSNINQLTVPALQFFKNWQIIYNGQSIVTYQEREWRYIPVLTQDYDRIILPEDTNFEKYIDKEKSPKPHLLEFALKINKIEDVRYIIIKNDNDRKILINSLYKNFGKENVLLALLNGTFMILNDKQIKNDF